MGIPPGGREWIAELDRFFDGLLAPKPWAGRVRNMLRQGRAGELEPVQRSCNDFGSGVDTISWVLFRGEGDLACGSLKSPISERVF